MGSRTLKVSPEILIALCKHRNTKLVTACTANALPDDAEIVEFALVHVFGNGVTVFGNGVTPPPAAIVVTLRSAEWEGEGGELPSPVIEMFEFNVSGLIE